MKVYHSTGNLPAINRPVITIGTFDGVHVGHQQILQQLKQEAGHIQGETAIITFHPHPRKVVAPGQPGIQLINTIEEKIELLDKNGIDHLIIVPFTPAFSQLTPAAYIEDFLVQKFHPHTVIIGYDHRFGQGRKGDYKLLEQYSSRLGFHLIEIPAHIINENTVSSTIIREAIAKGDMEAANNLLGYGFFFEGTVIAGNKLGRTLGYPTANLQLNNEDKLVPGNGVYAVEVEVSGQKPEVSSKKYEVIKGMMNIGVRPTVDGTKRMIEVNLFDFDRDIYGETVRVTVKKFLRDEQKFSGPEALKVQLGKDKEEAMSAMK